MVLSLQFVDDDQPEGILSIDRAPEIRVLRSGNRSTDSRRNSVVGGGNLEEIAEEEEDEVETYSKSTQLADGKTTTGKDVFGFKTPKKSGSMALKAQEELNRTPRSVKTTPTSKRNTPKTPRTGSRTCTPSKTPRSGASTPVRGILKTPTGQKRIVEPDTPASSRKRVKKTLIRMAETVETNRYSDEGSDTCSDEDSSDEENIRPIMKEPPATPRTPARKGRKGRTARDLDTNNMAESYFEAQSSKVLTSDRTLSKLKNPRLSEEEVSKLLKRSKLRYAEEIRELQYDNQEHFCKWLSLLHRGYNIITYGLGSKKSLIHSFHEKFLADDDCVVVNGYFPSLTIKSVLNGISEDILEIDSSFSSIPDHLLAIQSAVEEDLYLLVHNIDGPMLRNDQAQSILSELASHPKIHLVCSIDHINAPLIWDQFKLARLNLIWFDCTTFLPYTEEASGDSVMVKASGELKLASITPVLAAITPNAKKIFLVLARYQIENAEPHYPGIAFMELYSRCRTEFLVTSDLELKAQLTEFRDHKLVRSKRGGDGAEYIIIPIEKGVLASFIETIQDKI